MRRVQDLDLRALRPRSRRSAAADSRCPPARVGGRCRRPASTYSLRTSLAIAWASGAISGLKTTWVKPIAVAQVDEDQAAEIAPAVDPAVEDDFSPASSRRERAAGQLAESPTGRRRTRHGHGQILLRSRSIASTSGHQYRDTRRLDCAVERSSAGSGSSPCADRAAIGSAQLRSPILRRAAGSHRGAATSAILRRGRHRARQAIDGIWLTVGLPLAAALARLDAFQVAMHGVGGLGDRRRRRRADDGGSACG